MSSKSAKKILNASLQLPAPPPFSNPGSAPEILGEVELPSAVNIVEDIKGFPWHVDTKYYNADIHLCITSKRTIGNKAFADSVHAFVVHFDAQESGSLGVVDTWLPYLKEINPAVRLLVCHRVQEKEGISRQSAWEWCLENGFELVELNPEVDSEDEDSGEFAETTGVKRIRQALEAHTWPNLMMKDNPSFRSPYMQQMMKEQENKAIAKKVPTIHDGAQLQAESAVNNAQNESTETITPQTVTEPDSTTSGDENKTNSESSISVQTDNLFPEELNLVNSLMTETDNDEEPSFEELFGKLQLMKETARSLPVEERKKYAEQVAVQFWKAIGGDEEEILGLSDCESD